VNTASPNKTKFFVVLVDADATTAQRDAFTKYLRDAPGGFWHHVSHGWLIVNAGGQHDAISLRNKAKEFMPSAVHLVLEVEPVTWAGFFKTQAGDWIRKYWN
jgi:hypothetical protein